ncbi:GbsR/MarR family transcriptional regulator [Nocardioides caldifontis]|uniref:GbsR/MarR family transcriptional regulator n=1 Tax=Nocardioides caldifontis TaxID=2588938 RepID=UPI0011DF7726|nr:MarR family transcriptional regulator [Nocardioides caldifontis]
MTTPENLMRAVERFGQSLERAGMPRMASRVFAYVLAEDRESYTARELAEGLQVSPAAISGAVGYLVNTRLLVKERAVGRRGDLFRTPEGDIWATFINAEVSIMEHFVTAVDEAIAILDDDGPGARRLQETRDFFAFVKQDMGAMVDRWQAYRDRRGDGRPVT